MNNQEKIDLSKNRYGGPAMTPMLNGAWVLYDVAVDAVRQAREEPRWKRFGDEKPDMSNPLRQVLLTNQGSAVYICLVQDSRHWRDDVMWCYCPLPRPIKRPETEPADTTTRNHEQEEVER